MAVVIRIAALAVLYAGVARLGLMLGAVSGFATLVWPPTGIAIAALLVSGTRIWPGIAIGAFVANVWAGAPVLAALGVAAGNTLEAVLAVYLLRRAGTRSLASVRDVLVFVAVALAAPMVSATIGVASLAIADAVADSLGTTWRAWWLGDVMGALVVVPLVLASAALRRLPDRMLEVVLLAVTLVGVDVVIFSDLETPVRQSYLVFPPLIWAALRFGATGAAFSMPVVSAIAIAGTALGGGTFGGGSLSENLIALQAFMAIVAITVLALGAASSERDDAVRRREELLEVVSHELKNPLSSIYLSTEVILAKLPADDRLHGRALVVQRSADRMTSLIQSLLDLGAIESGRVALELRREDARAVVEEAIELLRPLAVESSHTLTAEAPDGDCAVTCDRERTLQVLANLVGNAIKHSPDPAAITVAVTREPKRVVISVRDTGPGIAADQVAHVFDRYWQARPGSRKGSGLGLFISRGLVLAQHGEIWVESTPGTGSSFHFTLPR